MPVILIDAAGGNRVDVRGLGLDSEWGANLRLRGDTTNPQIFGQVDLVRGGGEQFSPAFRALNPAASVPVLCDDDTVVTQSLAICEYLAARHGSDLVVAPDEPERPEFVRELTAQMPFYPLRHLIKPGLTGWAQLHQAYYGTIAENLFKLEYDLYYIKNRGPLLDISIALKTIFVVLKMMGR